MAQGTSFNMEEEFAGLDFHSLRVEERFVRTMETLIRWPDASIWEAGEDRAEAKSIYRMPANESFDREEIAGAHRKATIRRIVEHKGYDLGGTGYHGSKLRHLPEEEGMGYISGKTAGVMSIVARRWPLTGRCWGYWTGQVITSPSQRMNRQATRARRDAR
ncbi:MAG: transposase [Treponema sp.]|nr:transposase [Treponema sp.]